MDRLANLISAYAASGNISFGSMSLRTEGRAISITPDRKRGTVKLSIEGGAVVSYNGHEVNVPSATLWIAPKDKLCIQPDIKLLPGFLEPVIRIDLSSLGV